MSSEAEPFLLQHRCQALEFSISGPLLPISILDQMRRGIDFVEAAIQVGILGPHRPPLLVVGAGAGGVSAAIHAARNKGIPVLLVDKAVFPFGLQKQCRTRVLHPYQYEWPKDGWDHPSFPAKPDPAAPLPWSVGKAWVVAEKWSRILKKVEAANDGSFVFARSTTWVSAQMLAADSVTDPLWDGKSYKGLPPGRDANEFYGSITASFQNAQAEPVTAGPSGIPFPEKFSAILNATGFGPEERVAGGLRGLDFWDSDPFELARIGLPSQEAPRRVLISGNGDGALQDFLRITTGKASAIGIYEHLFDGLAELNLQALRRTIERAEDRLKPILLRGSRAEKHEAHAILDALYRAQIQDLLDRDTKSSILVRFDELLRHAQALDLLLVYRCNHLNPFYGLNRFLVLLCQAVVELDPLRFPIKMCAQAGLVHAEGAGPHHCPAPDPVTHADPGPRGCRNQPHAAQFAALPYCPGSLPQKSLHDPPRNGVFDLVIVRHGVVFPPSCP